MGVPGSGLATLPPLIGVTIYDVVGRQSLQ
jgi:hypothetical protein